MGPSILSLVLPSAKEVHEHVEPALLWECNINGQAL